MTEWAASRRLFQRDGAQGCKAPVLVFTIGTDNLFSLCDLSERDRSDAARWSGDKQVVF